LVQTDGAVRGERTARLELFRGVLRGPGTDRAVHQPVARGKRITTGAGLAGTWKMTGNTAHQKGRPDMGLPVLESAQKNGTSYWWCYTDEASTEWEYCSPPGEVLDTAYTVNGQDCIGECATQGENYWWCKKSPRTVVNTGKNNARDADWDYCSPSPQRTRYNKACSDACESREEKYYWCNVGSSWDYCSPPVETVEKVIAKGGGQCVGKCDFMDENYTWCTVINVEGEGLSTSSTKAHYWDYC